MMPVTRALIKPRIDGMPVEPFAGHETGASAKKMSRGAAESNAKLVIVPPIVA